MGLYKIWNEMHHVGTTHVGGGSDRHTGETKYIAACETEDCGWSAAFDTFDAAMIAAQGHRCPVR
ncbi:mobile element transfer protein [Streptomyces sp. TRM68416]|uniref:mobile element transfer protein n=1 Tax=Streptomyces sp. TRM68416 TaxID=2758412 RepID=UPI00166209AA|nr:mobile element transfer protein [Streptomyces sp. TRM68416]MBD0843266.1 Mobile element transfer [Streptomyces sp. TRM68416]